MRSFRFLAVPLALLAISAGISEAGCFGGFGKANRQARRAERAAFKTGQGACVVRSETFVDVELVRYYSVPALPYGPSRAVSGQCSGASCQSR